MGQYSLSVSWKISNKSDLCWMSGIDCVFLNQDAWPKESAGQRGPGPAWPPRGRFSSKLGKTQTLQNRLELFFSSAATPGGSRRPNGSRETGQRQTSKSLFTSLIWQVTIVYVLFSKVDNVEVGDEEVGSGEEETNSIEGAGEEEVRCIKKVMQVGRWWSSWWWWFDSDFLETLSRSLITLFTHAKFLNR